MLDVTAEQVSACLEALGVRPGDTLLVHSAIQFLGRPAGGVGMHLQALTAAIGPQGTLAVPAFNFAFARGEPYDPQNTPSQGMGAFSEWVRCQPGALRTPHPMQSLAVMGSQAENLAGRDTLSAFDPGSAFERLLHLDGKLLLLGADISAASMFHYSELRARVPYRYWKDFTGPYRTPAGWETRTYRMYVRDLEVQPQLTAAPVQERLEQRGQWLSVPLNYGAVSLCRLADFVAAVDSFLLADPWSLVLNRAEAEQKYKNIRG